MVLNLSERNVDSDEVMVRLYLNADDSIEQLETFIYSLDPDTPDKCSHAEWIKNHIGESYSGEDLRTEFGIAEPGVYQVLFKAVVHGCWSGWEIPDYDEWMEFREPQIHKMPDDWFDFGLKLDPVKEEPDHVE